MYMYTFIYHIYMYIYNSHVLHICRGAGACRMASYSEDQLIMRRAADDLHSDDQFIMYIYISIHIYIYMYILRAVGVWRMSIFALPRPAHY